MSAYPVTQPFHLAFPVHDLQAARTFYGGLLGCAEGRSSDAWVDFDLYGHQIVAHLAPGEAGHRHTGEVDGDDVPVRHFGVVLSLERPHWKTTVWLGGGHFDRSIEPGALLAQVDAALATAETQGRNNLQLVDLRADHEAPKSADEWAATIERALKENWVRLVSFPVIAGDGSLMHRECPLRLMFDAGGDWQPAGRFLPVAERLKLTPKLDLVAVKLGLAELESHPALPTPTSHFVLLFF